MELPEREERDGEEELVEPLVKLVRYDSSIPNALDSILPRYFSTLKIPMPHNLHDEVRQRWTAAHLPSYS